MLIEDLGCKHGEDFLWLRLSLPPHYTALTSLSAGPASSAKQAIIIGPVNLKQLFSIADMLSRMTPVTIYSGDSDSVNAIGLTLVLTHVVEYPSP